VFSAQFQQSPIPLEGNLIKRDWIRYFKGDLPRREGDYFVISWEASELADYSVGTVWQVQGPRREDKPRRPRSWPVRISRARRRGFGALAQVEDRRALLLLVIEDKGSGSSLIQSLKKEQIYAHQHHGKLEGDKIMRVTAQAAHFHAGVCMRVEAIQQILETARSTMDELLQSAPDDPRLQRMKAAMLDEFAKTYRAAGARDRALAAAEPQSGRDAGTSGGPARARRKSGVVTGMRFSVPMFGCDI
jgi:hypothetical protein